MTIKTRLVFIAAVMLCICSLSSMALFDDGSNPCPTGGPCSITGGAWSPSDITTGAITATTITASGAVTALAYQSGTALPDISVFGSIAQAATSNSFAGFAVPANSNAFVLATTTQAAYAATYEAGIVSEANPFAIGFSAETWDHATDQWWKIRHNQTDAEILTGKGHLWITPESGSAKFKGLDGNGMFWHHYSSSANSTSPGGSGATLQVDGARISYLLNATNEFLYGNIDMTSNWDANSDVIVEVYVALNSAETADDIIEATLVTEYRGEHDADADVKTQTRSVNHDITTFAGAGAVHELVFVLDYDLASHVIEKGDILSYKFYLDSVASVSAVRVEHIDILYRCSTPQPVFGSTPAEG